MIGSQKERGIVIHVAHVEEEVAIVAASAKAVFASSATVERPGEDAFGGGEPLGRLAIDSVGELVDCDCASEGVEFVPVECVCASFARLLV